jgi:hypothetical protein
MLLTGFSLSVDGGIYKGRNWNPLQLSRHQNILHGFEHCATGGLVGVSTSPETLMNDHQGRLADGGPSY